MPRPLPCSPFPLQLEPAERVLYEFGGWRDQSSRPYGLALSEQAVHYIKRDRLLALRESWHMQRLPLEQVQEVRLQKASARAAYSLLGFLYLLLLSMCVLGYQELNDYNLVVLLALAVMFFALLQLQQALAERWMIVIRSDAGTLRLIPQLTLSAPARRWLRQHQQTFVQACNDKGLDVQTRVPLDTGPD